MSPAEDALETRLAAALAAAARLFAAQAYYEAHEILEQVWLDCAGTDREALGGLILLAAALHKQRRQHNPRAARKLFARALVRLAPLDDTWRGIPLRAMERRVYDALADPALATPLMRT